MELSDIQERYLVNWYLREESLGRGAPTRAKLTSMALSLLFDGQEVQLNPEDEEWLNILIQRFLEQNPEIKMMVGRGENGGIEVVKAPVPAAPAPETKKKKPEDNDGTRTLWEPSAAEAAAAAAAMGYVSEEDDWEDEESDSEDEETESDESASNSDEDSEDSEDSDEDEHDSDSDTSTDISTDDLYNQAFVDSLFVKLESTSSPPPLSSAPAEDEHSLPIPQSSHDIQQHYFSALQDSRSATQTAQIVKTLCVNAGKALDLNKSDLEALWEKVDRLERENRDLKKKAGVNTTATAGDGDGDDDDELAGPDSGFGDIPVVLFTRKRHEQQEQQHEQQERQEGKRSSSSGSMTISPTSNVDANEMEHMEMEATTATVITPADKEPTLSLSTSPIAPPQSSATLLSLPVPPRPSPSAEKGREMGREGDSNRNKDTLDALNTNQRRLALARRLLGLRLEADKLAELELQKADPMQESIHSGEENEESRIQEREESAGSEESESESESESSSESDSANDRNESIIRLPTLDDGTSKIEAASQHSSNSRKRRLVDIEIALETKKMYGFEYFENIGLWTGGTYTIGPGGAGTKRRRITERRSDGVVKVAGGVSYVISRSVR